VFASGPLSFSEDFFMELRDAIEAHRRELFAHCYRITGSTADADDALQDAFVRAWKSFESFEGRSSVRRWLYTIATRTSLDVVERRKTRTLPSLTHDREARWLEPIPDDAVPDDAPGPEARITAKESVRLAFLAALQSLPSRQRATLILRDVVGYSAEETAAILELTPAAVNSALQRAREAVDAGLANKGSDVDQTLLQKYIAAFESKDAVKLAAVLRDDAVFSMPPTPLWFKGRDAIAQFFADLFARDPSMTGLRMRATRANGTTAVATYDASGKPSGLSVLTMRDGLVDDVCSFLGPFDATKFGLPAVLD
jgi:RNA polymerase sigma-70 factor (ECF subfamily)